MIRLIIADDQALVRDGLKLMIDLEDDIQVLGLAENGQEAVDLVRQHRPDLVLMDINMPEKNGIEATRDIKKAFPATGILVLTTYDGDTWIQDAIDAGADGYLLKDTPREELVKAVRGTKEGKHYLDPNVAGKVMHGQPKSTDMELPQWYRLLNDREVQVLKLIGQGKNNQQISDAMHLSEGTVRNYVSSVLTKLTVQDRTQAAILAVKHGLDLEA